MVCGQIRGGATNRLDGSMPRTAYSSALIPLAMGIVCPPAHVCELRVVCRCIATFITYRLSAPLNIGVTDKHHKCDTSIGLTGVLKKTLSQVLLLPWRGVHQTFFCFS